MEIGENPDLNISRLSGSLGDMTGHNADAQSSRDHYRGSLFSPDIHPSCARVGARYVCDLSVRLSFLTFRARNTPQLPGASEELSLCSH